ncbi:hypothetical protein DAEQUDRAFT_769208 [Daedalea quercina L-15889]|uniref:AAA+ ATPase domain-containing protein n=1 Tax=Daedalea quercina L-15889 TaxID=1314783 RepID=A0A165LX66_9APHY|nr:hypothetical protein DAEQUDRAFT_769208 [Daedalea quercina L-15889]
MSNSPKDARPIPGSPSDKDSLPPDLPNGKDSCPTSALPIGKDSAPTSDLPNGTDSQPTSDLPGGVDSQSVSEPPNGKDSQPTPNLPNGTSQPTPNVPDCTDSQSTSELPNGKDAQPMSEPPSGKDSHTASESPNDKDAQPASDLSTGADSQPVSDPPKDSQPSVMKRVDHVFSTDTRVWGYEDTKVESFPSVLHGGRASDGSDAWHSFAFVIVRQMPADSSSKDEPTVTVVIKSSHLRMVFKEAVGEIPGLSWTVDPLELSINLLIRFFPQLEKYCQTLEGRTDHSEDEEQTLVHLEALLKYLREDHGTTISQVASLLAHREITWDLLHVILVPNTLLVCTDPTTEEYCAIQLKTYNKDGDKYTLHCESLDAIGAHQDDSTDPVLKPAVSAKKFGRVEGDWDISRFEGIVKIDTLPVYPMTYHSDEASLREALLNRARKWVSLYGVHHVRYQGVATYSDDQYEINSRIMIDRATFRRYNSNYSMPDIIRAVEPLAGSSTPASESSSNSSPWTLPSTSKVNGHQASTAGPQDPLPEDELILAPPIVYGFSLTDILWLECNVNKIEPIEWSPAPFTNLALPGNRKDLLRHLVEAHDSGLNFDDFVEGKGQGLVVNLFGPSGVGKTLCAEATSEHLRRPLYAVAGADLGEDAGTVDFRLRRVFSRAAAWGAVVLIDGADIFLEQRSVHDQARNATVAVFLRRLEYYRGILFLTTSKVYAFDPAFLSRIHFAVSFKELGKEARTKIWKAFLDKVSADVITSGELEDLVNRRVSGRQIKNVVRIALSLAKGRQEMLGYTHLVESLDAMDELEREFTAMSRAGNLYS